MSQLINTSCSNLNLAKWIAFTSNMNMLWFVHFVSKTVHVRMKNNCCYMMGKSTIFDWLTAFQVSKCYMKFFKPYKFRFIFAITKQINNISCWQKIRHLVNNKWEHCLRAYQLWPCPCLRRRALGTRTSCLQNTRKKNFTSYLNIFSWSEINL